MGIVVSSSDLGEEKVYQDGGRWNRKVETGKYKAKVVDANDEQQKYGDPDTFGVKLVFLISEGTPTQLPEGPAKIDFEAYPSTGEMTSLCRTFAPGVLKGEKIELVKSLFIGRECNVLVNFSQKASGGKGKSYINKLEPIPGITDKAPEAAAPNAEETFG